MQELTLPATADEAASPPARAVLSSLGSPARRVRRRWRRLDFSDRAALGLWAAAHLAFLALAWAASWVFRSSTASAPLTGAFEHWDAGLLRNIAQYGYFSALSTPHNVVFFPGYPLVLAAVHLVLRNWVLSELTVSAAAGCFAVVSLSRLAGGRRVVLYLLTMPAAVFLMAGYSECLFLVLAVPAWRAAVRSRWARAALLAGLSGLVRPDALFLIPALAVMALTGPRGRRLVNAAVACSALAGPAAYEIYLTARTGKWNAWTGAQQAGWDLHLVTPLRAFTATWHAAFGHPFAASYSFEFQLELAAMAVMILATAGFLRGHRWPEAVYCGLAVIALGTQTCYQTCPRTLLVLFPVYVALARLEDRWPWARAAYLWVCAPLAAVLGLLFLAYQWAG
jgi:hypothetical protein